MEVFKKILERIHHIPEGQSKKKMIENTVIVIIIGIIIIIAGSTFFGGGSEKQPPSMAGQNPSSEVFGDNIKENDSASEVEKKMGKILSKIEGAGEVEVMITYVSGSEMVPAYDSSKVENNTAETDSNGGNRSIIQNDESKTVVFEEEQGVKKPMIVKEIKPEVKGVVVVADGAGDPVVKESLSSAIQALTDVPVHKIQVFSREKRSIDIK